jgi:hypothetical protein
MLKCLEGRSCDLLLDTIPEFAYRERKITETIRTASDPAEMRTGHFPNTSLEFYHYTNLNTVDLQLNIIKFSNSAPNGALNNEGCHDYD